MNQNELTVVSTLAGVFIGGLFGFLSAWVSKRSEERRALRELLIRVAADQHLHQVDKAAAGVAPSRVLPFRTYLCDVMVVSGLIGKRWMTPKRALRLLKKGDAITRAIINKATEEYNATKQ